MPRDEFAELIREALDEGLERHLGSVHEEIGDLRKEMNDGLSELREEVRNGLSGVKSEIGGVHNRVDNESFARKDFEARVRNAFPKLRVEREM
jgi:phage host-nuclease inhibitor protein Gam